MSLAGTGLEVSDVGSSLVPDLSNQHFTMIVQAIIHASLIDKVHVFVADSLNSQDMEVSLSSDMLLRSDGLILCSPRSSSSKFAQIFSSGKPVVSVNREFPDAPQVSVIRTDVVQATAEMVNALLRLGHRSFGYAVFQEGSIQNATREQVLMRLVSQAGGKVIHATLAQPVENIAVGVRDLVEHGCTAIVTANDLTATAVVHALLELGLRVPVDVSVTGFDDTPLAQWVAPRLTTARMHEEALGVAAWDAMKQLQSPEHRVVSTVFHAETIFRDSTGLCDAIQFGLIEQDQDVQFQRVPYESGGEVIAAVLGGHVDVSLANPSEVMGQLESGDLKPLCVIAEERYEYAELADIPTAIEQGINVTFSQFRGIIAPGGISDEAKNYWIDAAKKYVETDSFAEYMSSNYMQTDPLFGDDFVAYFEQYEKDLKAGLEG